MKDDAEHMDDLRPAALGRAMRVTAAALLFVGVLPWVAGVVGFTPEKHNPGTARTVPVSQVTPTAPAETRPTAVPIESLACGDAILADTRGEGDYALGETVDPDTWGWMRLLAPKTDGTVSQVEMLRPLAWMAERGVEAGGTTHISVPECGIDGDAEVLEVGPCPPVRQCPPGYATVTATFRHEVSGVWDVAVEGEAEPLGVTGNHPVWSEDRQDFVRADSLTVGEQLLNAAGESVRVTAAGPRGPPAGGDAGAATAVFNVEVHGQHVYRVGGGGLLVHNGAICRDDVIDALRETLDRDGFIDTVKLLDSDAIIGLRGSTGTGFKGPHKGNAPWDPDRFDLDIFIISDKLGFGKRRPIGLGDITDDLRSRYPHLFEGLKPGGAGTSVKIFRPGRDVGDAIFF